MRKKKKQHPKYMEGYYWKYNKKRFKHAKLYFVFKRDENNGLLAWTSLSRKHPWSNLIAYGFKEVPNKDYFKPQDGHFIICSNRKYNDIRIIGIEEYEDFHYKWEMLVN